MSGYVALFAKIDITSKTETYIMSESVELFTNVETARPQDAVDDAFIKTPEIAIHQSTVCTIRLRASEVQEHQ